MTVSTATSFNSYAGNGSTTSFAYAFKIFQDSNLVVTLVNDATGVETTQTLTTDYTVTGAGSDSGGNVVFVTAPASGNTVVIRRVLPVTQETNYVPNDPFPAEAHEDALDKLTMLVQQEVASSELAVQFPEGDVGSGINNILPSVTGRSDKLLKFGLDGGVEVIAASDLSSAIIGANYAVDTFTGTGSTTVYTLSAAPGSKANTAIYIDGVYQAKANYSVSGSTLTFTTAPPLNSAIEIVIGDAIPAGAATTASAVSYTQGGTGAVTTNVQAKLRETVSVKDFGAVGDGVTDDTAALQAMIDYLDGIGVDQYFIEGTIKVTSQIDLKGGQLVGSGSMSSIGSAKIITATSLTRADGAVFSNGRGARYITFEPQTAYAEDLFYTEFLTTLTECRFTNYNSVLCKANNDGDFVCVYVDKCHFVNVRHAILTDGQDGGASSDNNIIQFTNNYCFGLSGTQDISTDPDKYHGFQNGNIGDSSANAFIHLGVMRAGAVTGNTFERLHYILHAEGFSDTLLGNNYFEAVDITYTWDYADNSTFNRPIGLGDTAQTNDVLYHTFREHHQPDAIGFRGQRVFRLETVSGTFTDGETITTSGGDSAVVVQHETTSNVMDVRQLSGTFSDGEVITGSTSTETATIESSRELKYAKYGHIVDMSGRFGVNILRSNNVLGHDEPVVIGAGSNAVAATSYDVVPTDNNWVNAVFENQTNDAERSAIILNTHDSSGGYTNLWYAFEVTRDTAWTEAELKIFRRDAGTVDELFKIDRNGHWLPATDVTYNLGGTSNQWQKTYTGQLNIKDGITAPSTESGHAVIYVDSADGDLKVKFGDGTVKTISTDT